MRALLFSIIVMFFLNFSLPAEDTTDAALKQDNGAAAVASETKESVRNYLDKAREVYKGGDQPTAAAEVNKAIILLRKEASRSGGETQDDLRDAIKDLENLSGKLERKECKSENDLKDAYGNVYQKLSWYHYAEAERAYKADNKNNPTEDKAASEARNKRLENARRHLNESLENFGDWSHESGHKLKEGTKSSMTTLKKWTGKALASTGNVTENIGESLNRWGEELRSYGHRVTNRAEHQRAANAVTSETAQTRTSEKATD